MILVNIKFLFNVLALSLILVACASEKSSNNKALDNASSKETPAPEISETNSPPIADAGKNQTKLINQNITLDGSASFDAETPSEELSYQWVFISATDNKGNPILTDGLLNDASLIKPTFTPVVAGEYKLSLNVSDGTADNKSTSEISIQVYEHHYYAYIPDISSDSLHVINTDFNQYVDNIPLHGSPREVRVSHSGKQVFVSTEYSDDDTEKSYINIINTELNLVINNRLIEIEGDFIQDMVLTKDDNVLYVTHQNGLTKVTSPGKLEQRIDNLALTYTGLGLVISEDDKYLFVLGKNQSGFEGISVTHAEDFIEITTYDLPSKNGTNEILIDNSRKRLFATNSVNDDIIAITINNYDDPQNLGLDYYKQFNLPQDSNPVDMALNNNKELFIVLSYIKEFYSTGNGKIITLDSDTLTMNSNSEISEIQLSDEGSLYTQGMPIHPIAIDIDDKGDIHILKRIWSDAAGLYLTKLPDTKDPISGNRTIQESQSYNIGERANTLANGNFLGPACSTCPTGLE